MIGTICTYPSLKFVINFPYAITATEVAVATVPLMFNF